MNSEAAPPTPNFYLNQAAAAARNTRAWIHRYQKLHPEGAEPSIDPLVEGTRVAWVMGVLDDLDHQLQQAIESVDHHVPTASSPTRLRARRELEARTGLNLHQLARADDTTTEVARWVDAMRWSERVTGGDLDRLELLARGIKENLRHLLAQAQEQHLAE